MMKSHRGKQMASLFSVGLCLAVFLQAQNPGKLSPKLIQKINEAKAQLQSGCNTWNVEHFKNARNSFLNLLMNEKSDNAYLLYYIALSDYRLVSYFFSVNNRDEAEKYNSEGQKYLEKAIEVDPSFAEPFALYATFMGFEIALHPEKAMTLGMKSFEYFSLAFQKGPDNARVNLLQGISLLYTPEMYGGGPEKAIEYLNKSAELFEKENVTDALLPSWGKEEAYTFLGLAHNQKKNYDLAEQFLKKALEVNPEYGRAKELLQEIKK